MRRKQTSQQQSKAPHALQMSAEAMNELNSFYQSIDNNQSRKPVIAPIEKYLVQAKKLLSEQKDTPAKHESLVVWCNIIWKEFEKLRCLGEKWQSEQLNFYKEFFKKYKLETQNISFEKFYPGSGLSQTDQDYHLALKNTCSLAYQLSVHLGKLYHHNYASDTSALDYSALHQIPPVERAHKALEMTLRARTLFMYAKEFMQYVQEKKWGTPPWHDQKEGAMQWMDLGQDDKEQRRLLAESTLIIDSSLKMIFETYHKVLLEAENYLIEDRYQSTVSNIPHLIRYREQLKDMHHNLLDENYFRRAAKVSDLYMQTAQKNNILLFKFSLRMAEIFHFVPENVILTVVQSVENAWTYIEHAKLLFDQSPYNAEIQAAYRDSWQSENSAFTDFYNKIKKLHDEKLAEQQQKKIMPLTQQPKIIQLPMSRDEGAKVAAEFSNFLTQTGEFMKNVLDPALKCVEDSRLFFAEKNNQENAILMQEKHEKLQLHFANLKEQEPKLKNQYLKLRDTYKLPMAEAPNLMPFWKKYYKVLSDSCFLFYFFSTQLATLYHHSYILQYQDPFSTLKNKPLESRVKSAQTMIQNSENTLNYSDSFTGINQRPLNLAAYCKSHRRYNERDSLAMKKAEIELFNLAVFSNGEANRAKIGTFLLKAQNTSDSQYKKFFEQAIMLAMKCDHDSWLQYYVQSFALDYEVVSFTIVSAKTIKTEKKHQNKSKENTKHLSVNAQQQIQQIHKKKYDHLTAQDLAQLFSTWGDSIKRKFSLLTTAKQNKSSENKIKFVFHSYAALFSEIMECATANLNITHTKFSIASKWRLVTLDKGLADIADQILDIFKQDYQINDQEMHEKKVELGVNIKNYDDKVKIEEKNFKDQAGKSEREIIEQQKAQEAVIEAEAAYQENFENLLASWAYDEDEKVYFSKKEKNNKTKNENENENETLNQNADQLIVVAHAEPSKPAIFSPVEQTTVDSVDGWHKEAEAHRKKAIQQGKQIKAAASDEMETIKTLRDVIENFSTAKARIIQAGLLLKETFSHDDARIELYRLPLDILAADIQTRIIRFSQLLDFCLFQCTAKRNAARAYIIEKYGRSAWFKEQTFDQLSDKAKFKFSLSLLNEDAHDLVRLENVADLLEIAGKSNRGGNTNSTIQQKIPEQTLQNQQRNTFFSLHAVIDHQKTHAVQKPQEIDDIIHQKWPMEKVAGSDFLIDDSGSNINQHSFPNAVNVFAKCAEESGVTLIQLGGHMRLLSAKILADVTLPTTDHDFICAGSADEIKKFQEKINGLCDRPPEFTGKYICEKIKIDIVFFTDKKISSEKELIAFLDENYENSDFENNCFYCVHAIGWKKYHPKIVFTKERSLKAQFLKQLQLIKEDPDVFRKDPSRLMRALLFSLRYQNTLTMSDATLNAFKNNLDYLKTDIINTSRIYKVLVDLFECCKQDNRPLLFLENININGIFSVSLTEILSHRKTLPRNNQYQQNAGPAPKSTIDELLNQSRYPHLFDRSKFVFYLNALDQDQVNDLSSHLMQEACMCKNHGAMSCLLLNGVDGRLLLTTSNANNVSNYNNTLTLLPAPKNQQNTPTTVNIPVNSGTPPFNQ